MSVLIFDTETNDRKNPEPIEIAYLRIGVKASVLGEPIQRDLPITEEFEQRYKPSRKVTFGSIAVHHILPHELEGCLSSDSFVLADSVEAIVGHSIDFDWRAISSPNVLRICTHAMAQHVWQDADGYSQSALIYMLHGANETTRAMLSGAHGALTDVCNNRLLLLAILKERPEILTWQDLWLFSEECRIPRTCPMRRYEGVPLDELDDGFIEWCLRLDDLDPYYRKGLERVMRDRYGAKDYDDDQDFAEVEDDEFPF
jgi:exodeoxyribonuclease X